MFCLEDERETSIDCFPHAHQLGTEPASLGMCPDQESNPQPFGIQDNAPTNWTNWPGQAGFYGVIKNKSQFEFKANFWRYKEQNHADISCPKLQYKCSQILLF